LIKLNSATPAAGLASKCLGGLGSTVDNDDSRGVLPCFAPAVVGLALEVLDLKVLKALVDLAPLAVTPADEANDTATRMGVVDWVFDDADCAA